MVEQGIEPSPQAPGADFLDQHTPAHADELTDDGHAGVVVVSSPGAGADYTEADPADLLEQSLPLPAGDEDYPRGPAEARQW